MKGVNANQKNAEANAYAQSIASNPLRKRSQTLGHFIDGFSKDKPLSKEQAQDRQRMIWEMDITPPIQTEDGSYIVKASDLRNYAKREMPEGIDVPFLEGETSYVKIGPELAQRVRDDGTVTQAMNESKERLRLLGGLQAEDDAAKLDKMEATQMRSSEVGQKLQQKKADKAMEKELGRLKKMTFKADENPELISAALEIPLVQVRKMEDEIQDELEMKYRDRVIERAMKDYYRGEKVKPERNQFVLLAQGGSSPAAEEALERAEKLTDRKKFMENNMPGFRGKKYRDYKKNPEKELRKTAAQIRAEEFEKDIE